MGVGEPTDPQTHQKKRQALRACRGFQSLVLLVAVAPAICLIAFVIADELEVWRWPLIHSFMQEPGWGIPVYRVLLLFIMPYACLLILAVLGYRLAARRWLRGKHGLTFPLGVLGLQVVATILALWAL